MRAIALTAATSILSACSNHQPDQTNNVAAAATQRPSDAASEAYMRKAEVDWAKVAVRPMPGLIERIIADDYVVLYYRALKFRRMARAIRTCSALLGLRRSSHTARIVRDSNSK
jgi:hypothetical protein